MSTWISQFIYNPVDPLVDSPYKTVSLFAGNELTIKTGKPIREVWTTPEVVKILKKQNSDGSWKISGKTETSGPKYPLIETWKNLRFLIDQYHMTREHPSIERAADYVFSCQSSEGDIRGMLANQYAPYYTGAILYLLIKAGFQDDSRIQKGMNWLVTMRQNDGGWVIGSPGLVNRKWKDMCELTSKWTPEPEKEFDRTKPFSAAGTGMVLRAFSVHPEFKKSEVTLRAAHLLKSKLFKEDNWSWYRHPDNWLRFQFPFWWTNIISALDTLSLIGISKDDIDVKTALKWIVKHQQNDGLWKASYSKIHKVSNNKKSDELRFWVSLCICRIFKRFFKSE